VNRKVTDAEAAGRACVLHGWLSVLVSSRYSWYDWTLLLWQPQSHQAWQIHSS